MALSQEDKYRIVFALCLPGKILIAESTHYNSIVASRLINLNSFIEDQAIALVEKIEASRTKLEASPLKDNVKQIGDIQLDTTRSRELKTKELKRLLDELSSLLDIPNRCKAGGGSMACLVL